MNSQLEQVVLHEYFQHIQLSAQQFEPSYDKVWCMTNPEFKMKGPLNDQIKYFYPRDWRGYALKLLGQYDDGNDDWLKSNSNSNQWHIMYHGTTSKAIKNIIESRFIIGHRQIYKHQIDIRKNEEVGSGIHLSNHIEVAELYAELKYIDTINYRAVLQVRVRPQSLKQIQKESQIYTKRGNPDWDNDYFVVNRPDDIRPYRILLKEEKQSEKKFLGQNNELHQNGRCLIF